MEAQTEAHSSFLEEWKGQEDAIPLLAVNPLLAVKPPEAAPAFQAKTFPGPGPCKVELSCMSMLIYYLVVSDFILR